MMTIVMACDNDEEKIPGEDKQSATRITQREKEIGVFSDKA